MRGKINTVRMGERPQSRQLGKVNIFVVNK